MLLLAVPTAATAQSVQTTTEFEGVAPSGGEARIDVHTENGFEFCHLTCFEFFIFSSTAGTGISNGTDFGFVQNPPSFNITHADGQSFQLVSIDAGQAFGAAGGTLAVTGTYVGGGTVETTFATMGNQFQTFNFDGAWTGLESVVGNSGTRNFLAIDNVVLVAVGVAVPGSSQDNPILPDGFVMDGSKEIGFEFLGVPTGSWIANEAPAPDEPPDAIGYDYTILNSTALEIEFPVGLGDQYLVTLLAPLPGTATIAGPFPGGTRLGLMQEFGVEPTSFRVSGPGLVRPDGFPLSLSLSTSNADIQQVPEPSAILLQAASALGLAGLRFARSRDPRSPDSL
jgi:hypothetical protein